MRLRRHGTPAMMLDRTPELVSCSGRLLAYHPYAALAHQLPAFSELKSAMPRGNSEDEDRCIPQTIFENPARE